VKQREEELVKSEKGKPITPERKENLLELKSLRA